MPDRFRYHLILADGHRSMYNTALLFGSSALAWKAMLHDCRLPRSLPRLDSHGSGWVEILRALNRLAMPGRPPRVNPLVIATQRAFLEAAGRFAGGLSPAPPWVPRVLRDWSDTLDAMQHDDRPWLAARLDPFIKYEFFSSVLHHRGKRWGDVPGNAQLCTELELLNYSYHELTDAGSYFDRLEQAGALQHRVAEPLAPGAEPEPFVPQTETRAKTRARFIISSAGDRGLVMDWGEVCEPPAARRRTLWDPFAAAYGPWEEAAETPDDLRHIFEHMRGRYTSEIPF